MILQSEAKESSKSENNATFILTTEQISVGLLVFLVLCVIICTLWIWYCRFKYNSLRKQKHHDSEIQGEAVMTQESTEEPTMTTNKYSTIIRSQYSSVDEHNGNGNRDRFASTASIPSSNASHKSGQHVISNIWKGNSKQNHTSSMPKPLENVPSASIYGPSAIYGPSGICSQFRQLEVSKKNKSASAETDQGFDGEEHVENWLRHVVKLPQYINIFIQQGYESLDIIREIKKKEELEEIGIIKKGHQTKIMAQILRLSEFYYQTDPGYLHLRLGVSGSHSIPSSNPHNSTIGSEEININEQIVGNYGNDEKVELQEVILPEINIKMYPNEEEQKHDQYEQRRFIHSHNGNAYDKDNEDKKDEEQHQHRKQLSGGTNFTESIDGMARKFQKDIKIIKQPTTYETYEENRAEIMANENKEDDLDDYIADTQISIAVNRQATFLGENQNDDSDDDDSKDSKKEFQDESSDEFSYNNIPIPTSYDINNINNNNYNDNKMMVMMRTENIESFVNDIDNVSDVSIKVHRDYGYGRGMDEDQMSDRSSIKPHHQRLGSMATNKASEGINDDFRANYINNNFGDNGNEATDVNTM